MQIAEQPMEPIHHPSTLCGQLVSAVGEQPEDSALVLANHPPKVGVVLCYRGHAVRVDAIGLAPVAAAEQARPCGKRGGHVDHGLPGGDQLLGEQVAEAAGALDRPGALGPVAGPALEPRQGALVGRHSQLAEHVAGFIQCHGGVRRLVRIDPDGDHVSLLL
jgi:hypothetical protein